MAEGPAVVPQMVEVAGGVEVMDTGLIEITARVKCYRKNSGSLIVSHMPYQQRRTRCGAWCEGGPGQPLAPEHRDKTGALSYQQETPENSEVM